MGLDMTGAGAALLTGGAGLLTNFGTGLYNAYQASANRKFQMEMYMKQRDDAIKFWKMQNQYNLPSAQLQRIRDAGLSPLLMYGEGGLSGNIAQQSADLPAQPHGAQASASFSNPVEMAQYALLDAQKRNIDANTEKTKSETDWTELQTKWDRESYDVRLAIKRGDLDYVRAKIRDIDDQIFQRGFMNTQQAITMAQARLYEIKRYNLDENTVTTQLEQGWNRLLIERTQANAALRQAAAAWQHAINEKYLTKWQVGAMAQDIYYKAQYQPYKLQNMDLQNWLNSYDVYIKDNSFKRGVMENEFYYHSQGAKDVPSWMVPFFIVDDDDKHWVPRPHHQEYMPMWNQK